MKKVLIAIDNEPSAERVALHGFQMGNQLNAEIAILSVVDTRLMMTTGNVTAKEMIQAIKNELMKFHSALTEKFSSDKPVVTFIEQGNPYEVILESAKQWSADLIVMGTHGRTGLTHLLMGSVAEKVIRHSTIQVLIVPNK